MPKSQKPRKKYIPRRISRFDALRFDGAGYAKMVRTSVKNLSLAFELKLNGGECTYEEVELVRHFMMVSLCTLMNRDELIDERVSVIAGQRIQDGLIALAKMVADSEKRANKHHYWAFPKEARTILDGLEIVDQLVHIAVEDAPRLFMNEALTAELLCIGREYNSHFRVTQDEVKAQVKRFTLDRVTRQEWEALKVFHSDFETKIKASKEEVK